jgi:hypothetical protein
MSRSLARLGIEHVVLERGAVAQRWRTQSWDSLRLLTPNWMTRLPGFHYVGPDPDGFMAVPELITFPRTLCGRVERARPDGDDGHRGRARVRRLPGDDQPGSVARPIGGDRHRLLRARVRARRRAPRPAAHRAARGSRLQTAGRPAAGRRAGGWRLGTGVQIADEVQLSGRPVVLVGRTPPSHAAAVPRQRHPVVARSAGRAVPSGGRRVFARGRAAPAVDAARGPAGSFVDRPADAARHRRAGARPAARGGRRGRVVRRRPRGDDRGRGCQAGRDAEQDRRVHRAHRQPADPVRRSSPPGTWG